MKRQTRLLRLKQIIGDPDATPPIPAIIPISRSAWYAGVRSGKFPPQIHLGRTSVWREEDVLALAYPEAGSEVAV